MNPRRCLFRRVDGKWIDPSADYGIYTITIKDTPPEPKTAYVELPGRDDVLDMSEWAGTIRYGSRKIEIALRTMNGDYNGIIQDLYGLQSRIYTDDDTDYYFEGRCDKAKIDYKKYGVWDINLTFTVAAYKLRQQLTIVSVTTTKADTVISLKAERRPVVPTITADAACTITVGTTAHSCSAGVFQLPDLLLTDSAQDVIISESGKTVSFAWQDGRL